ncbi:MAG: Kazal-type serine protease inhibitor domain protein [Thermodesulfobacteriota bacterium]
MMTQQGIFQVFLSVALLLLMCSGFGGCAAPKVHADETIKTEFQYSAKVLCSMLGTFSDGFLGEGVYRTVINIHNPTDKKVTFTRKFAVSRSLETPFGEFSVTPYKIAVIEADDSVVIDCFAVSNFFCPIDGVCIDFTAIDGFLVIDSPVELDVVAVYTARPPDGKVTTLDVENVKLRKIKKKINVVTPETKPEIKQRIKRKAF